MCRPNRAPTEHKLEARYPWTSLFGDCMVVSDELEMRWKEAVVVEFKVVTRHVLRGTEQDHEIPQPR
jgi:hypothetical protein